MVQPKIIHGDDMGEMLESIDYSGVLFFDIVFLYFYAILCHITLLKKQELIQKT